MSVSQTLPQNESWLSDASAFSQLMPVFLTGADFSLFVPAACVIGNERVSCGYRVSISDNRGFRIYYSKGETSMKITDVRVRKVTKEGKMKAIVSITIDDEFVVHDIKVIEGEKGLFIAMPSKKATDGEYRDIAHPINQNTREAIQSMILEKYEEAQREPEEV